MNSINSSVIMLPSDKPSSLGHHFDVNEKGSIDFAPNFGFDMFNTKNNHQHRPQNLYFLAIERLKEGDNVFSSLYGLGKIIKDYGGDDTKNRTLIAKFNNSNTLQEYHRDGIYQRGKYETVSAHNCKKVIASTDDALDVLRPSIEFLKKYSELNGIDDVKIECNEPVCKCDELYKAMECKHSCGDECMKPNPHNDFYGLKPKVSVGNTITIL